MLVFLQSLPWVTEENMGDEISSALPATYFFPLVSAYPTPILSPHFLLITCETIHLSFWHDI